MLGKSARDRGITGAVWGQSRGTRGASGNASAFPSCAGSWGVLAWRDAPDSLTSVLAAPAERKSWSLQEKEKMCKCVPPLFFVFPKRDFKAWCVFLMIAWLVREWGMLKVWCVLNQECLEPLGYVGWFVICFDFWEISARLHYGM